MTTRRDVLKLGSAGLAGILATGRAPAAWAQREVSLLTAVNYASGDNYNHPMWRDMENHPIWDLDAKYKPLKEMAKYSHLYGWPAPPDERTQQVTNAYIIPNMVAKVVTNAAKPAEAIAWAETEIKKIMAKA